MSGTPPTLRQAVKNGRTEAILSCNSMDTEVAKHVRDYLAQKFAAYMLTHDECADVLKRLFEEIKTEAT